MKSKVFFILILSLGIVFYLFYSMDYSAIDHEKIEENINIEKKIDNNIVKNTKNENKAKDNNKSKENKKEKVTEVQKKKINKDNKKTDVLIESNDNLDNVFVRNIFKQFKKIIEEEIVETLDQKAIDREQYINTLKSRLTLNFVMLSEFDKVALINRKKFRIGDIIEEKELKTTLKEINEDNVLLMVGTEEVKIGIKR